MTPQEVRIRGFKALKRELGVVSAFRFMHQYERGEGDYSKERHALIDELDLDTIMERLQSQSKT